MNTVWNVGVSRTRLRGMVAALIVAIGLAGVVAAQGVPQAGAKAAAPVIEPGLRAADDATELATAICAEITAAKDAPASQLPLKKIRDLTTAARSGVADAEATRAAALEEMLASKVVRQDMLEKLRRASQALLDARARRFTVQAIQNLIEPCAADRLAELMPTGAATGAAAAPVSPPQDEVLLAAALDSAVSGVVPPFRRLEDSLVLMDQALRVRVSKNVLTAAQADAVLREWATSLALKDLSRGPDPEVVAIYRPEASSFLSGIQKAIPAVTKWPDDRPATEYQALAKGLLQLVGELFTADFARGLAPTSELIEGQIVLAWAQGSRDVVPARDVFADEYDRLLNAIASAMPALPRPRPAAGDKACHGFAGTWTTNYGDVILAANGDQIDGENPSYRAKIKGRVTGQTLQGTRAIAGYADASIRFTLAADGSKFEGTVDLAPGHSVAWTGSCQATSRATLRVPPHR